MKGRETSEVFRWEIKALLPLEKTAEKYSE
jgi:hypothetical protein